jgi:hypothetical protein
MHFNTLFQVSHCFLVAFHCLTGCRGVVHVLQIPRCCTTSCRRHCSKFSSWSVCSSIESPKWQKKLVTGKCATQFFLVTDGINRELVHGNQGISIAPLAIRKGTCDVDAILLNGAPPLYWCIRPQLWVQGLQLLHRCCTVGTNSPLCSLHVASCTAVLLCPRHCWYWNDLWMILDRALPIPLHLAPERNSLSCLGLFTSWLSVVFWHTVPHHWEVPLSSHILVDGTEVISILHSGCCSASASHRVSPMSLSSSGSFLRSAWSQPSTTVAAVTHTSSLPVIWLSGIEHMPSGSVF